MTFPAPPFPFAHPCAASRHQNDRIRRQLDRRHRPRRSQCLRAAGVRRAATARGEGACRAAVRWRR
eukprot:scaffold14107_cov124-Isochrysis_galbana.AAC.1